MSNPAFRSDHCLVTDPLEEVIGLTTLGIQDLPEEVFEIIAGFLPGKDLDNCFNVCKKWRRILNSDKFWKKCCIYPEKYYKLSLGQVIEKSKHKKVCEWRKHYLLQKGIWENWRRGRFVTNKSGIFLPNVTCFMDSVDEHGNHWLFDSGLEGITIWNITASPVFHGKYNQNDHFGMLPIQEKLMTCRSNYVKVFNFKYPDYELQLNYRFKFERNVVLPEHEVVPEDDYVSGVRYIIVDNHFFIGYNENVSDIRKTFIHIWDLNVGSKVSTQSVFQQSFMDFIISARGSDAISDFSGGLILFAGDNGKFLVNLIDERFKLCHISLFCLMEMKFINVVAQLESRTAWCFLRGDIAVIFHIIREKSSQISVYTVNGDFLAKLDFPAIYNPALTDEFRFDSNKVILKVDKYINVLTIMDSVKVRKNYFKVSQDLFILKYFDPKFLLLFDKKGTGVVELTVSIWDVDSGAKLWKLGKLSTIYLYRQMLNTSEYPGRMLVHIKGEREISILNFDRLGLKEDKQTLGWQPPNPAQGWSVVDEVFLITLIVIVVKFSCLWQDQSVKARKT